MTAYNNYPYRQSFSWAGRHCGGIAPGFAGIPEERQPASPDRQVVFIRKLKIMPQRVTITGNAGGVPELLLEKIFGLYVTTRKALGGSGIGLYMSKNIIEKSMGGTLSVTNAQGGAQFRIEIPLS